MTEKQWGPKPGVHLREMSVLQRCLLKESGLYAHGGQQQQSLSHPLSIFRSSLKSIFQHAEGWCFSMGYVLCFHCCLSLPILLFSIVNTVWWVPGRPGVVWGLMAGWQRLPATRWVLFLGASWSQLRPPDILAFHPSFIHTLCFLTCWCYCPPLNALLLLHFCLLVRFQLNQQDSACLLFHQLTINEKRRYASVQ